LTCVGKGAKAKIGDAIAYIRVSTQKQAKSGLGLEAQADAIAAFAKAEGYKIVGRFTEHESGKGADTLERLSEARQCS
jgi:DNA invertase Pin-like site-specific DNA recombinase